MIQGGPWNLSTVSIIANWNNSDALSAQIFGFWNERVARNFGLEGVDKCWQAAREQGAGLRGRAGPVVDSPGSLRRARLRSGPSTSLRTGSTGSKVRA